VKEDPAKEKEALSTLVNHPAVPFLLERMRLVGRRGCRDGGIESLEALEAAMFRLVAPEVCWLGRVRIEFYIGVVAERRLGSVGEVETIGGHCRLMKQVREEGPA
jgi:hypothetical protein